MKAFFFEQKFCFNFFNVTKQTKQNKKTNPEKRRKKKRKFFASLRIVIGVEVKRMETNLLVPFPCFLASIAHSISNSNSSFTFLTRIFARFSLLRIQSLVYPLSAIHFGFSSRNKPHNIEYTQSPKNTQA
jgi:uncharacterized protein YqhQ